jgi:hypothetical protein
MKAPMCAVIVAAGVLSATLATAQDSQATPDETGKQESAPRPGLWRVGVFYVSPRFRIGTIGLDTNVLYTPTERTTDVSANGGPGLELVLPLGGSGRFYSEGYLDYLYFAKTDSQRKLTGSARGGFDFKSPRSRFNLEESWVDTFSRPSFEVNQRVRQTREATTLDIKRRLLGRISLLAKGGRARFDVASGTEYLGANLAGTLTRDEYRAGGGLDYAITVKTSFVVEDEQRWDRYRLSPLRDANSNRVWAGIRTDETALIAGHALVGQRFYDLQNAPVSGSATVADVDADWNVSPKTKLGGHYGRDLTYSALPVAGVNPLLLNETYGARIDKFLSRNLNLRLFGRVTHIKSESPVAVNVPGEGAVERRRNDKYRQVGADLGYLVRPNLRVGVAATYGDQNTTIDYLGVEGLVVGATVRYNP